MGNGLGDHQEKWLLFVGLVRLVDTNVVQRCLLEPVRQVFAMLAIRIRWEVEQPQPLIRIVAAKKLRVIIMGLRLIEKAKEIIETLIPGQTGGALAAQTPFSNQTVAIIHPLQT